MLITFFTNQAEKLFSKRWWFLLISLIGMGAIFLTLETGATKLILPTALLVPFIAVPWGLLCMCFWFHPTKGNLYVHSKIVSKLPASIHVIIRWYFAIFLALFFIFGLLGFPIFGLIVNGAA
jgi:hypothetical protein